MNVNFIVGVVLFVFLIGGAIVAGGTLASFLDIRSLLIVLGGGFAITLMSFSFRQIGSALDHVFGKPGDTDDLRASAYLWLCVVRNLLVAGVIGTIIGLILMLQRLDDPSMIGPATAVALLTTLYAVFFSAVFPLPALFMIKRRLTATSAEKHED